MFFTFPETIDLAAVTQRFPGPTIAATGSSLQREAGGANEGGGRQEEGEREGERENSKKMGERERERENSKKFFFFLNIIRGDRS